MHRFVLLAIAMLALAGCGMGIRLTPLVGDNDPYFGVARDVGSNTFRVIIDDREYYGEWPDPVAGSPTLAVGYSDDGAELRCSYTMIDDDRGEGLCLESTGRNFELLIFK